MFLLSYSITGVDQLFFFTCTVTFIVSLSNVRGRESATVQVNCQFFNPDHQLYLSSAWSPRLREELEPAMMAAEYPQHAQLIFRLARPEFYAQRGSLFQSDHTVVNEGVPDAAQPGQ